MNFNRYFQSYHDYFWQWEEGTEVLAIPNSSTIAYRDFIIAMLRKLSPQGLPPFGSLLLAVIATNAEGSSNIDVVYSILLKALNTTEDSDLARAVSFCKLLSELPSQYKEGEKRLLLLQAIFESCHNIVSISKSRRIVSDYTSDPSAKDKLVEKGFLTGELIIQEIRTLSLLERRFPNAEVILERMASLAELGEEVITDLKITNPIVKPESLIDQWIADQQTHSIAVLIRHLWSALTIPFHNSLPSEQPIGGVSDLTNKGDFDKLLISEFANDDLLFLSRLANNEALYLNREVPPQNNKLQRFLLIDVSLKNWGTPKAIAYAIMLAIAKHPKTDMDCVAYAVGEDFYKLSFGSVHELIESSKILSGCLHPVKGIQRFIERFSDKSVKKEVFFISSVDSQRSEEMQRLMSEYHDFFNYWIAIDSEGKVSLSKRQQKNKKHIQEFQLPLQQLWRSMPGPKKQNRYFANLPLLLRTPQNVKTFITGNGAIFQISSDKKVYRFFDKWSKKHERGWELVAENLPFAPAFSEIGFSSFNEYFLLLFRVQDRKIFILNLKTGASATSKFEQFKSSQNNFLFHNDLFYYISSDNNWTIDLKGEVSKNSVFPKFILDKEKERKKQLSDISQKMAYQSVILKNVNRVFINQTNNLVFNVHELHINNGGVIKLDQSGFLDVQAEASLDSRNRFVFKDGSSVEVKRSGLFILKSSNVQIPDIYIPAVLDAALGVATHAAFSGSEYFYKEQKASITLRQVGPDPSKIAGLINEFGRNGLGESIFIIDTVPVLLFEDLTLTKANDLRRALEKAGGMATIEISDEYPKMEMLTPKTFFSRYIDAFMDTIKNGA
ncbi:hypothetical protein [Desertivirga arenae]|uniref:hypothetical protein n=1 Tax=Desertivirga arenae TaxID=2810309 RepID=UPI001A95AFF6|nr:hypothetical protein [Pedobacter sp. SYSU D00823]